MKLEYLLPGCTVRGVRTGESTMGVRVKWHGTDTARELCYRLDSVSDRNNRAADALAYNSLVGSWPMIVEVARSMDSSQADMLDSRGSQS